MFFYNRKTGDLHAASSQHGFIPGAGDYRYDVPGRVIGNYASLADAAQAFSGATFRHM